MKKNRLYYIFGGCFLLIGLFAFVWPAKGEKTSQSGVNELDEPICQMVNEAFAGGEKINYKIYYNLNFIWIPAAEVIFEVKDLGDQFYIKTEGKTLKSYDWFFKVRDTYEVTLDKETLLPTHSVRQVQEGGYRLFDEMHYDHDRGVVSSLRGKTKEKATLREYPISNCIHDILSVIYYARNLDFDNYATGDKFPVNIFMDKEEWKLNVEYGGLATEKKVKGRGKFNTYLFHPEVISGDIFKDNTQMNVYVSQDENRIPLLIESPISVGSIKAVMTSSENLRHGELVELPK